MGIRIIIADDHKIMRDGLRTLLDQEPDMEVAAEAENGREIVQLVQKWKPDVVIMDVSMPELNGFEATRQILQKKPDVKVVALSMHADKRFVAGMFDAGAKAYLLKDSAFSQLAEAIRNVHSGRTYLGDHISDVVVREYVNLLNRREPEMLTSREKEILQLLAEGKTTKEAAAQLRISIKTIETHRQHMMEKLNIFSVAGLTKYAIREGITSLEAGS
jgi:two-component system response regulator NreC